MTRASLRIGYRRPNELLFWLLVLFAAIAFLFWIHHRDSQHDRWDWSDWVEAAFAAACGGFVVVGVLYVAATRATGRFADRHVRRARRRARE